MTKLNLRFALGALLVLLGFGLVLDAVVGHDAGRSAAVAFGERRAAVESTARESGLDAGSRAALGHLALVAGAGVLAVAWLDLRRHLTAANGG